MKKAVFLVLTLVFSGAAFADVTRHALPKDRTFPISRAVEEAVSTTQGLAELESSSRAGESDVVLEFRWGTDMDRAGLAIRERLQTTFLPADATRPLMTSRILRTCGSFCR